MNSNNIVNVNVLEQHNLDMQRYGIYISRDRSIPDYKDGFKPVQRRILWAMHNDCNASDNKIKSAQIVGAVSGKYHPHGTSSIYGAMKTMTNWFEIYMPLIDPQGNFGSFQGDKAASERYTEAKLSKFTLDCVIGELKESKQVVDWSPNYDGSLKEPVYLPVKVPLLLINGSFGISLVYRVDIPKHNINEVIDATVKLIDNPNADVVLIPDTCMPCEIIDTNWKAICNKGLGNYKVRGIVDVGEYKGKPALFIRSIPDLVFLDRITEKIEKLIETNKIVQIADMIENSNEEKMEFILVLKKGSDPEFVKNLLYKNTELERTCRINLEVLDDINPLRMSYKSYLLAFIEFRKLTKFRLICNKIQYLQTKIHERALYIKVLESGEIDNIISMIKKQTTTDDTPFIEYLIKKLKVTDLQAKFILNTDLRKLSKAYLAKYKAEAKEFTDEVEQLMRYVTNDNLILNDIKAELLEYKKKYGCKRRSRIIKESEANNIPNGEFKVIITNNNFIKKVPVNDPIGSFRGDSPKAVVKVENIESVLLFDDKGKVFNLEAHKIPFVDRNSNGTDIRLLIKRLTSNINTIMYAPVVKYFADKLDKYFMVVLSAKGYIKKLDLEDFLTVPASGIMFMKLDDDDYIKDIIIASAKSDLVIYSHTHALRMNMSEVPHLKRNTKGLKSIGTDGEVDGLSLILKDTKYILVLTEKGMVNKFSPAGLPLSTRGKRGSKVIKLKKGDNIKAIYSVDNNDIIRITTDALYADFKISDIPEGSSISEGVRLVGAKSNILRCDIISSN